MGLPVKGKASQEVSRAVGRWNAKLLAGMGVLVLILVWASPAFAHAIRQRFDLPIPLGLYLAGAGATVALSFVVIALFTRRPRWHGSYPRVNLLRFRIFRAIAHPSVLFAVACFLSVSSP